MRIRRRLDAAVAKRMYPRVVEGRNNGGVDEYRGAFVAYPRAGFGFYSHHGFSDQWLQTYDQQYSAKGMALRYSQMFTGASGATLHCATWTD